MNFSSPALSAGAVVVVVVVVVVVELVDDELDELELEEVELGGVFVTGGAVEVTCGVWASLPPPGLPNRTYASAATPSTARASRIGTSGERRRRPSSRPSPGPTGGTGPAGGTVGRTGAVSIRWVDSRGSGMSSVAAAPAAPAPSRAPAGRGIVASPLAMRSSRSEVVAMSQRRLGSGSIIAAMAPPS